MKIYLYVLTFFILFNCSGQKKEASIKIENNTIKSVETDTLNSSQNCIQKDTTTKLGTKIKYINDNGLFKISYSNSTFNRISDSSYNCYYESQSGLWDFVPKFETETKNNLIFTNVLYTSSGGNPAPLEYSAIIFPKNKYDSIREIEFFILSKDNYLVYGDGYNMNLHILNVETKKVQNILLKPKPDNSRSPTMAILETEIKNGKLYIKYESLNENSEIEEVERTFRIEI